MNAALKVCPQCGTEYPANARFCEIDGTALRSAAGGNDLVGSIVADRYHIMKKLGEGGMGQVYLAEHVKMGRKSALKVMHPGMKADVDAISRFNREAANASRIAHPNVAAVYDFGETPDGIIYLAMEFVDGPPLTNIIEQQGALPPKRAAEIVRQTAEALAVAHDMAIVHRDLKPDNIMVARTRDGGDLVKVVDFGIAKAAGNEAQKVTKTGLVVGTPEYMSPEQLSGDQLDGRSDIYSLGLVAYNMLTGKLPFPSDSAQESMIMRLTDKPKPLAEMKGDRAWPADVQAVMDRALERDAKLRYQNATDFGMALYNAIQRMPETAAAEAGTAVMDAVPPTRVASIAEVPSLTATVAIPTPVANRSVAPPAVTTPPAKARKNTMPIVIGATAVVIVGAFVAMKSGAKTQTRAAGDTTVKSAAVAAPVPTDTTSVAKPQGNTTPAPATATSAAPRTLAQLEADASTDSKADGVLAALDDMKTKNDDERARVNFIRFKAYTAKEDAEKACLAIKEAVKLATDPAVRDRYQQRAEACQ